MTTYKIIKGKCEECFNELMLEHPKDINYIKNQVKTKMEMPKEKCLQLIIGNQILIICEKHYKELQKLFEEDKGS